MPTRPERRLPLPQTRLSRGVILATFVTAALSAPGCGGGKGGTSDAGRAGPSATITPEKGGTITSADGRLTLVVPPGAVAKPTEISVAPLSSSEVDPTAFPAGVAYRLAPRRL